MRVHVRAVLRSLLVSGVVVVGFVGIELRAVEVPRVLFHWTNSRRFEGYEAALARGRVPMKQSKADRFGATDAFFAVYPHLLGMPVLFTWGDFVGGMGSTKVEWYAKMDLTQDIRPRVIVLEIEPTARVKTVISESEWNKPLSDGGLNPHLDLDGIDLVYHEYRQTYQGQSTVKFREWIVANEKAVRRVRYRLRDIMPFVHDGIRRLETNEEIEAISPNLDSSFRDQRSRDRALGVLLYIRDGKAAHPRCSELFNGDHLRRKRW